MTPTAALNIALRGHGASCDNYSPNCSKCLKEDEAVKVLRALIAAQAVPAEEPQPKAQEGWTRCEDELPPGGRVVWVFDATERRTLAAWKDRSHTVWFPQ